MPTTVLGSQWGDYYIDLDGVSQYIYGYDGDDTFEGAGGHDSIYGHDDQDHLFGGAGFDLIFGGNHKDTIRGGPGDDTLHGDDGNDSIRGDWGDDLIYGGEGRDTLGGGYHFDTMFGGGEADVMFGGTGPGPADISPDLMYGDGGNDLMYGIGGSDTMYGGANDDTQHGGQGVDFLYSGDGDDDLFGGNGDDFLFGGAGIDDEMQLVPEMGLVGSSGASPRDGSRDPIDDEINRLYGGGGRDQIFGSDGDDHLDGGNGSDNLVGGNGADHLIGGAGADRAFGGNGSDIFSFRLGDVNRDVVFGGGSDGSDDDKDTIDLSEYARQYGAENIKVLHDPSSDPDQESESGQIVIYGQRGEEIGSIEFHDIENIIIPGLEDDSSANDGSDDDSLPTSDGGERAGTVMRGVGGYTSSQDPVMQADASLTFDAGLDLMRALDVPTKDDATQFMEPNEIVGDEGGLGLLF